jgi:NTE family protein
LGLVAWDLELGFGMYICQEDFFTTSLTKMPSMLSSVAQKSCVIFLLLFLSQRILAQEVRNLVLEGAGIRGVAYAGGIRYLEEKKLIDVIDKVAGTSAGAIAALTISLGYTSKEIEDLIYRTKLQKFNDGRLFFIGGFARMNRHYGWYRGTTFLKWLEKIIYNKTGNADITFKELHDRKFKDLYVTGTSLNHQKLVVFSYQSYPQMKVKDAVRISMSIPLYFKAVIIDSLGHVIGKRNIPAHCDLMIDGGFTGNFPITVFDSVTWVDGVMRRIANPATMGLRIDTPEQIKYDSLHGGLVPVPISRFRNYVSAFYNYTIENLNRGTLTIEDWKRTVSISSGTIGPKIRKLSSQEKDLLIANGYAALQKYFAENGLGSLSGE